MPVCPWAEPCCCWGRVGTRGCFKITSEKELGRSVGVRVPAAPVRSCPVGPRGSARVPRAEEHGVPGPTSLCRRGGSCGRVPERRRRRAEPSRRGGRRSPGRANRRPGLLLCAPLLCLLCGRCRGPHPRRCAGGAGCGSSGPRREGAYRRGTGRPPPRWAGCGAA